MNAKKIVAVKDATHAVEKRKPEKFMSCVFDCDDLFCIISSFRGSNISLTNSKYSSFR